MRRQLVIAFTASCVLLVLGALGSWLAWRMRPAESFDSTFPLVGPPYPIEASTFDRIRLGMAREEVEKAIGEPSGEYDQPDRADPPRWGQVEIGYRPVVSEAGLPYKDMWEGQEQNFIPTAWHGKEFWIEVAFDENEKVVGCYLEKPRPNWWR